MNFGLFIGFGAWAWRSVDVAEIDLGLDVPRTDLDGVLVSLHGPVQPCSFVQPFVAFDKVAEVVFAKAISGSAFGAWSRESRCFPGHRWAAVLWMRTGIKIARAAPITIAVPVRGQELSTVQASMM